MNTSPKFCVLPCMAQDSFLNTIAYLDAGTGSLVIQMMVGGFVTALYVVKTRWASIRAAIRRLGQRTPTHTA